MRASFLSHVRVIEVANDIATSFAGKLLAQLGATVVKVELPRDDRPQQGALPADVAGRDATAMFAYLHAHKQSIALDPRDEGALVVFEELLRTSAVVIIDVLTLRQVQDVNTTFFDDLSCSVVVVSPYGLTGSKAHYKSYPLTTFHAGGEAFILPGGRAWEEHPERQPLMSGSYAGEMITGMTGLVGALLAIYSQRSGKPLWLDLSQEHALAATERAGLNVFANTGQLETRATRNYLIGGLVPTADGYIEVLPLTFPMWQVLAEVMAEDGYPTPPVTSQAELVALKKEMNAVLRSWASTKSSREAFDVLGERGCAIGLVRSPQDLLSEPQLQQRGFWDRIDIPGHGICNAPGLPFPVAFGVPDVAQPGHVPELNEHAEMVLQDLEYAVAPDRARDEGRVQ